MLCDIRDEASKIIYLEQLKEVQAAIKHQNLLHKQARVVGGVLDKLITLRDYLELQIRLYKEINRL